MNKKTVRQKMGKIRFVTILYLICHFSLGTLVAQAPAPSNSPPANSDAGSEPVLTAGNVDTSGYPSATVNFTIEKAGAVFRQLETSDVEVLIDNKRISLRNDALRKEKDSEAVKVLFVIDRSGSMKIGADKLQAAKDALNNFVGNLSPIDEVAVSTFGESYTQSLPLTKVENKSTISAAIEAITANDKYTNFYKSVEEATAQAETNKIKNIIFLSDGKEDNEAFNKASDKAGRKSELERTLSEKLRNKGIRFFAVAIGNPEADPSQEEFVDYDSMKSIAEPTQGKSDLVNMPQINAAAKGNKDVSRTLIAEKLKGQLAEIKKALKFSYALVFDLPNPLKNNGLMVMNFNISDGVKRWQPKAEYPYTLKNGRPVFEKASVSTFLVIVKSLDFAEIFLIFLLLLLPLGFLATIPTIFSKVTVIAEERKVNEAIENIKNGSHLIGKQCPNESGSRGRKFAFNVGDTVMSCPQCGTPHHLMCWAENKFQCMNRLCESRYQIPENILVKHNMQV